MEKKRDGTLCVVEALLSYVSLPGLVGIGALLARAFSDCVTKLEKNGKKDIAEGLQRIFKKFSVKWGQHKQHHRHNNWLSIPESLSIVGRNNIDQMRKTLVSHQKAL